MLIGIFVASWAFSFLIFRWKRLDQPLGGLPPA
jgi:hypothetical protein